MRHFQWHFALPRRRGRHQVRRRPRGAALRVWCSHPDRYYDAASATCKECGNVERYALKQLAVLLAIIIFLALLRLASIRMPRLLARVSGRLAHSLQPPYSTSGFRPSELRHMSNLSPTRS